MLENSPPSYLQSTEDIGVWHALKAALEQVRAEAEQRYVDDPQVRNLPLDNSALDREIRDDLIPRALAAQAQHLPPGVSLPPFAAQVLFSSLRGYAELDPLLLDQRATEIMIDGPGQEVYVERDGILEGTGLVLSAARLSYLIERIIGDYGHPLTEAQPIQEAAIPGARVTAVHQRLAPRGPSLVVRLHARRAIEPATLIADGSISEPLWDALATAFAAGANVLIAGEISSGKTTLLQALLSALPAERRIVTIEDPIEIDLPRARVQQLEVRYANVEGAGAFNQRQLVRLSLRLRPDHLIVGEVRDGAAWDMVDAMSLGHNGSIATIHAASPIQAVQRLESLCLRAEDVPPLPAVRLAIADAVNLIVQMGRMPERVDGRLVVKRTVVAIEELVGLADPDGIAGAYILTPLAAREQDQLVPTGNTISPALAERLRGVGGALPFGTPPTP